MEQSNDQIPPASGSLNPKSEVNMSAMDKVDYLKKACPANDSDHRHGWHYHLGGVRHSRVPLSLDVKEVLEVAYVSKVMSKNFRKEGQPEKERIAHITGVDIEKIQEWFKNRRKKDRHNSKISYKIIHKQ